jgi:ribonuclease P protein component
MLSKSKRLSTKQFDEVFKKGRIYHSPLFVMRVLLGTKDTRFSAVSPNKANSSAVGRNTARRAIYRVLRGIKPQINNSVWVIIISKSNLLEKEDSDISNDLKSLFVKSHILE